MFEGRLKQISKLLEEKEQKKFFILTHKKHRREIYFTNSSSSIQFIRSKFNSKNKRIIYLLIKLNLLQPFLKKIYLSKKLGDTIFVGGQIKGFDLKNKKVYSFPLKEADKDSFLKGKYFQKRISKNNLAPVIEEIDKMTPFSKEEFLMIPERLDVQVIFKKIMGNYKIKKIKIKDYLKKIIKKEIKEEDIKIAVKGLTPFLDKKVLITAIHGDFSKEQILIRGEDYLFTDWSPRIDLIISDLVNFFGNEEALTGKNLIENKNFLYLLEMYPSEVKKNLWLYLILNEISLISKNPSLPHRRLKFLLSIDPSFKKY